MAENQDVGAAPSERPHTTGPAHTPGPWANCQGLIVRSDQMHICDIRGWGYLTGRGHGALGLPDDVAATVQNANARLIAAAPDMLAALRLVAGLLENARTMLVHNGLPTSYEQQEALQEAHAAIAKATGGR